jgi:protein TonB
MGYQALLFCPDEKTARTVTQVLSELDFAVVPCTEPFAAVKKLMAEHFDAVVVDCDNEQNATLLFKSARNTAGNQASLAVAVVEGQAGVAKAFRIGANLVLTKPINVEQAKGTLRVARGLLRKSEAAKSVAATAGAGAKPSTPVQPASKPDPQATTSDVVNVLPALPGAPLAAPASVPLQQSQPGVMASGSGEINRAVEPANSVAASPKETSTLSSNSAAPNPGVKIGSPSTIEHKLEPSFRASSAGFGTGSASAPAPAREKAPVSVEVKAPAVISQPEVPGEVAADLSSPSIVDSAVSSVTLASEAGSGTEPRSGSKKAILGLLAVALIAAGGYEAWMQWGRLNPSADAPAQPAAQVAKTPVTTASAVPRVSSPVPTSVASQPAGIATTSSTAETTANEDNAPTHQNEIKVAKDSGKPAASTGKVAAIKPIVIKNEPASGKDTGSAAPIVSMNGIAGSGSPNFIGGGKTPTPVLQTLTVSQGVSEGLLVKKVQPVYPASALRMHVEGGVQLLATVSKNGDISAIKILSGDSQLARAAADAVKQWKYKPYLLDGSPVEIQTQITVKFKLPR